MNRTLTVHLPVMAATTNMHYDELKEVIENWLREGTIDSLARACAESLSPAGLRALIASLDDYK